MASAQKSTGLNESRNENRSNKTRSEINLQRWPASLFNVAYHRLVRFWDSFLSMPKRIKNKKQTWRWNLKIEWPFVSKQRVCLNIICLRRSETRIMIDCGKEGFYNWPQPTKKSQIDPLVGEVTTITIVEPKPLRSTLAVPEPGTAIAESKILNPPWVMVNLSGTT